MYEKYLKVIEDKAKEICFISDTLWDNPETAFEEFYASDVICEVLEKNGFKVTREVAGIPFRNGFQHRISVLWSQCIEFSDAALAIYFFCGS